MYDLKTGKEFLYFDGHEDTIIGAHFSNDGKHLATASRDNTLILWDTVIGKQIFVFEHERIVICCCFSRDGKYIVSGCQDKVCRVWSTKKGKELLAFKEHEGIITAVSYSPDGENIVSASSDRTLRIWSSTTGTSLVTIQEHTGIVMACMYSIDGNYIVSNDEKIINVWDVKKGKVSLCLKVDDVPFQGTPDATKKRTWTICSCCPGPFSFFVVAACSDRNVYILHPQSGEVILSFFCKAAVYCLSSGLRNTLALGDAFGNIYVITLN
jgi:WD40 repeat protein